MDALQAFLLGWLGLSTLVSIGMVGKPRKPSTPAVVVISTLINTGVMAWIIFGWPS